MRLNTGIKCIRSGWPVLTAVLCGLFAVYVPEVLAQTAAPRSIEDVLKVLEHYKPDPAVAQQARAEADRPPPNTTDPIDLFKFYSARAQAAQRIGRVSQQIADLKLALKYSPSGPDRRDVMNELSSAEGQAGDYASALALRQQVAGSALEPGAAVGAQAVLARFLASVGDLHDAHAALEKAESALRDANSLRNAGMWRALWVSRIEFARGGIAMAEGKFADAEAAFRRAVMGVEADIATRRNPPNAELSQISPLSGFRRQHAAALARLNRLSEAELVLRTTLRAGLERYGRYSVPVGGTLGDLAGVLFQQGRNAEGVILAHEAVNILEKSGAVPESTAIIRSRRNIGTALAMDKRWQEANVEFERMHEALKSNETLRRLFGAGDLTWSFVLVRLGAPEKSVAMLNQMVEQQSARWGASSFQVAETRGFRGIAYAAAGQRDAALKEFREAVPVLIERINDQAAAAGGTRRTWRLTRSWKRT